MDRVLGCHSNRRFGVEIELNTTSGVVRVLDEDAGQTVEGAELVADLIHKTLRKPVEIHGWHTTNNNAHWIVKPDSSCGIEVCSPVLKGWRGLSSLLRVVDTFGRARLQADERCSLHVHANIADLNYEQLASVMAYYIKCESVIFDSFPACRKTNRYCMLLGHAPFFEADQYVPPEVLIERVSSSKYYSLNSYHFLRGGGFGKGNSRKQTLEFRTAENTACLDPMFVKNWVRFILHFIDVTKGLPYPKPYEIGDPMTGLVWLDPQAVFQILRFNEPLSPGLTQVRKWFINRVIANGFCDERESLWSNRGRAAARQDFAKAAPATDATNLFEEDRETQLFGKKYIV